MKKKMSHSQISTYLDCQKKWELQYIKGLKVDNVHFQFGNMGHSVLETRVIPEEMMYPELKEAFNINSWKTYFTAILNELDEYFENYELIHSEYQIETDDIKGIIDAVWKSKLTGKYVITDYKFSNTDKGLEDILLDEQMYIYALAYASTNGLTLDDIEIGYVNIPKSELDKPRVLKNGQLSKDKNQNTTHKKYLEAINELGLNKEDYEDVLSAISGRTLLNITISPINYDMCVRIMTNIDNVIKDMQKGYVLEKCTFMCKRCDYLQYCKYNKEIKNNE